MSQQWYLEKERFELHSDVPNPLLIVNKAYQGYIADDFFYMQQEGHRLKLQLKQSDYCAAFSSEEFLLCSKDNTTDVYCILDNTLDFLYSFDGTISCFDKRIAGCLDGKVYEISRKAAQLLLKMDSRVYQVQNVKSLSLASNLTKMVIFPMLDANN